MRKLFLILLVGTFLASCNHYISPEEAANGKAKCGRWIGRNN